MKKLLALAVAASLALPVMGAGFSLGNMPNMKIDIGKKQVQKVTRSRGHREENKKQSRRATPMHRVNPQCNVWYWPKGSCTKCPAVCGGAKTCPHNWHGPGWSYENGGKEYYICSNCKEVEF